MSSIVIYNSNYSVALMNNILAAKLTAQNIKAHNTHLGGYSVTVSKHRLAQKCYDHAILNTQVKPVSKTVSNQLRAAV